MIIKSLIIVSILFSSVGLSGPSDRIDGAIVTRESNRQNTAIASSLQFDLPEVIARPKIKFNAANANIYAKNYILVDAKSGKVLLKENIHNPVPIASTTKIMTAIIALENYKLDDVVTVSDVAANQIGADTFIRSGEQIYVSEMLKGLLIKSGNDTAYALAEHLNSPGEFGTKKFVDKMNQKAAELGMQNTDYRDPAGLDTVGYSSAYDLYLITKYALKNPVFSEIVRTKKTSFKNIDQSIWHEVNNSNRLVNEYNYLGAIGVKTGYMPESGHVLVSAVEREGHTLIGVVINTFADTAPASADESR